MPYSRFLLLTGVLLAACTTQPEVETTGLVSRIEAPRPTAVPPQPPLRVEVEVAFAADQVTLAEEDKARLDALIGQMRGRRIESIAVGGRSNDGRSAADRQKLTMRRGEAIKFYLVAKGLEAARIGVEVRPGEDWQAPPECRKGAAAKRKAPPCVAPASTFSVSAQSGGMR